MRYGELAHFKLIPHTPYYGTADATPLYLITLHSAWRAIGDRGLLERHLETAEACLSWIDKYGDRDGDGFQEYQTRSPVGTRTWVGRTQVSVVYPDGSLVKGQWLSVSFKAMSTMPGCAWPRCSMRSANRTAAGAACESRCAVRHFNEPSGTKSWASTPTRSMARRKRC